MDQSKGFGTQNCGITIQVEPISGAGQFNITPCRWVDTPGDITEVRDQLTRTYKADEEAKQIISPAYVRNRKSNLLAYVTSRLDKAQQKDFMGQVEEMKSSPDLKGLSDQEIRWLASVVTRAHHGVKEIPDKETYRYA